MGASRPTGGPSRSAAQPAGTYSRNQRSESGRGAGARRQRLANAREQRRRNAR